VYLIYLLLLFLVDCIGLVLGLMVMSRIFGSMGMIMLIMLM